MTHWNGLDDVDCVCGSDYKVTTCYGQLPCINMKMKGWELCTENVQPVICHACQQHRGKTSTNGRQDLQHTEPVDVTPALMMLSYRGNVKPATPKTGSRDDARINMSTATPHRTC